MDVDVAEGQAVDVVLDFDACRSVVKPATRAATT
jgi:hypothetical protein